MGISPFFYWFLSQHNTRKCKSVLFKISLTTIVGFLNSSIQIRRLHPNEHRLILQIAHWYYDEWETPVDKTVNRLSYPHNDGVLVQLVLTDKEKLIATGGIAWDVNIVQVFPQFKKYGPWLSLLLTHMEYRNRGFGEQLLLEIEKQAKALNFDTLYLSTFTAEGLYRKCGWEKLEEVTYKNHKAVIMKKYL